MSNYTCFYRLKYKSWISFHCIRTTVSSVLSRIKWQTLFSELNVAVVNTPLLKGRQNLDLEQWCRLWQEFFPCIWCTLPKIVNSVKEYSVQEYSKNEINTENNIQDLRREFFLYINIFIRYEWLWILIFGKFLFIKIKFSNHSFNSLLYG